MGRAAIVRQQRSDRNTTMADAWKNISLSVASTPEAAEWPGWRQSANNERLQAE